MYAGSTRAVEAFLKKTAIAYRQILVLFLEFRWRGIEFFFKNASTSRVCEFRQCFRWDRLTGARAIPSGPSDW